MVIVWETMRKLRAGRNRPFQLMAEGHIRQLGRDKYRTVNISPQLLVQTTNAEPVARIYVAGHVVGFQPDTPSGVTSILDWHRPAQPLECPSRIAGNLELPRKFGFGSTRRRRLQRLGQTKLADNPAVR